MPTTVRRIRADEWPRVRDFRLEAVADPAAPIAFLSSADDERAHSDEFWRERAATNAAGDDSAQFVAVTDEDAWLGTATALRRVVGQVDHLGRPVTRDRIDIVGVYVAPDARGRRIVDLLFEAVAAWAADRGAEALTLDVHRDNARARAAYARAGFTPTGVEFTGPIGPELELSKPLP